MENSKSSNLTPVVKFHNSHPFEVTPKACIRGIRRGKMFRTPSIEKEEEEEEAMFKPFIRPIPMLWNSHLLIVGIISTISILYFSKLFHTFLVASTPEPMSRIETVHLVKFAII